MPKPRKRHSPDFKARVALEAIRGLKTTAQLASEFPELRYLYRNWGRLNKAITFYVNLQPVTPPWINDWSLPALGNLAPARSRPTRRCGTNMGRMR